MHLKTLSITTGAGTCPAKLFLPEGDASASVLLYMDAFGPRPALDAMAGRLVGEGYAVLLPDLLYRCEDRSPFNARTTFSDPERGPLLKSMLAQTSQAMTIEDTAHFLAALDGEGLDGPVGVTGYCMGGARALNAAAYYPDRVAAAASWHGGNLAGDIPDSPHLHAGGIRGRIHVGVAGDDGSFPPEQSARFAQVFREAGVDYTMENYPGCRHGWCVPDHAVYDEAGAERHWKRLLTLFEETLKG
ncbi:MAG: dienelactone hydrolase [Phyllobacteriaceae bacterium]|nr:dienelactone hydrolase [Phyllobacteriaceae bacterium]MBA90529.1 dienelactone hydrolase [Phyllobacteriaceae bacterium]